MNFENYHISSSSQNQIKQTLLETYFKDKDPEYFTTEYGKNELEATVNSRYLWSLHNVVPWVMRHIDLKRKKLIEIGCGTGSSTIAFAHFVDSISAYDIDEKSIDAARKRADILKIRNIDYNLVTPENLISTLQSNHEKIDIILFFAVLEHMTIEERHSMLRYCWKQLKDDGLMVVVETPNLLQYFDSHTSVLPFFHMLPSDICSLYSKKSPRDGFNDEFSSILPRDEIDMKMTRWGRGISYHDFELTLGGNYAEHIVANGFEPEILTWFPVNLEEEILRFYITEKNLHIPDALTRSVLNIIFKKDNVPGDKPKLAGPPTLTISTGLCHEKLADCRIKLQEKTRTLDDILSSKRWKIGNFICSPYRYFKKFILGKDI